jgi:exopolyphosphatase/guanosine-5'-triphosphate,3'-diphosphate pyrophosphatase
MFGAIDLGSNSFRAHIGNVVDGTINVFRSTRESNRMAAGLDDNNFLTPEAIERGLASISRIKSFLDAYPLSEVRAVATNTFRVAKNASEFLIEAEKRLGHPIDVISGEEEGRLIYLGVANVLKIADEKRLVIDIGGGSTEVIVGLGHDIKRVESFPIGTVPQSLGFFKDGVIDAPSFERAILFAKSRFEDAAEYYRQAGWTTVYGSSGTIRATGEMLAANDIGDGLFTLENLLKLKDRMIEVGRLEHLRLEGIKSERVTSILGGLTILIVLMELFQIDRMFPIEAGLRVGVIWDTYLKSNQTDRRERTVDQMVSHYFVDRVRAQRVSEYALSIYSLMADSSDELRKLLYWSALLHEIGIFISPTRYHRHGAYILQYADMAGFMTREQYLMSRLVLGQMGNLNKVSDILDDADALKALFALRLAVMFHHAKVDFKPQSLSVSFDAGISLSLPGVWLSQYETIPFWLDREKEFWQRVDRKLDVRLA